VLASSHSSLCSSDHCPNLTRWVYANGNGFNSQSWTTLRELQQSKKYRNVFRKDPNHSGMISIWTEPQLAIGQRTILCCTRQGNILWDCITYLDDETVARINELGGVAAIVISHPHYYTTMLHWAEAFGCPVYLSGEDEEWVLRKGEAQQLWTGKELELLDGQFRVVKVGGHFPGSSVMWWKGERKLFVADTITVVPSGVYHVDRLPGTSSFTFMWSYPNMVGVSHFLLVCGRLANFTCSRRPTDSTSTRRGSQYLERPG
jgi:hypothetical protein